MGLLLRALYEIEKGRNLDVKMDSVEKEEREEGDHDSELLEESKQQVGPQSKLGESADDFDSIDDDDSV